MMTMATALSLRVESNKSSNWILDSACTSHMTNNRGNFTSCTPQSNKSQVGNAEFQSSEGIGNVRVSAIVSGETKSVLFKDVLYVPSLLDNLISLSKVCRNGYRVKMDDEKTNKSKAILRIIDNNSIAVQLVAPEIHNGLFEGNLTVSTGQQQLAMVTSKRNALLWH